MDSYFRLHLFRLTSTPAMAPTQFQPTKFFLCNLQCQLFILTCASAQPVAVIESLRQSWDGAATACGIYVAPPSVHRSCPSWAIFHRVLSGLINKRQFVIHLPAPGKNLDAVYRYLHSHCILIHIAFLRTHAVYAKSQNDLFQPFPQLKIVFPFLCFLFEDDIECLNPSLVFLM
jgi:hypothetical protein